MERFAQLLDDLDDLICAIGLVRENIRRIILGLLATVSTIAIQVGGIFLALAHPPLALALVILLFVTLLYHAVTNPRLEIA